jgi:hypothetical protein
LTRCTRVKSGFTGFFKIVFRLALARSLLEAP